MNAIKKTARMRKALRTAAAGLLLGFPFYSCADFLKGEPEVAFSKETFFVDTVKLSMASLGVYEILSQEVTYGRDIPVLDVGADLMLTRTLSASPIGTNPTQIGVYNISPTAGYIAGVWHQLYNGVNRANVAISNSQKLLSSSNAAVQKSARKYVAETKVLRAFYYMDIVRRWGDAPLRTEETILENSYSVRVPKKLIYDQIIRDLEEAVLDLPWHDEDPSMEGRLNKGSALGLLARACLFAGGYSLDMDGVMRRPDNYMDYYTKAEIYTYELVNSGKHALNPSYENVFYNLCQNVLEPKESMFEIDFAYLNGNTTHVGRIGSYTIGVTIIGKDDLYNVKPQIFTHYHAYSKYDAADLRGDLSVARYALKGIDFTPDLIATNNSTDWGIAKWRRDWHSPKPLNRNYTDVNYPMLRYAEVLLMRAEALNELNGGPTDEAIELVNKVRRRGYGKGLDEPSSLADVPAKYLVNKDAFFNFLTEEYAREFLGEHGRKFHLIRWNLLKQKLDEVGDFFDLPENYKVYHSLKCVENGGFLARQLFVTGKHELWPIPFSEVTTSNGHITTNNPGY